MPRGVYSRKKAMTDTSEPVAAAKTATETAQAANKAAAQAILSQLRNAGKEISALFSRVENTTMDIGKKLFDVKQLLDSAVPELRRAGVPRFSTWMNETAPELCNMTKRSVWYYYQAYAEAQVAGLSDKTISALAPTLLKNTKTRQAVVATLTRNPELAVELNSAARNPAKIKQIAKSEEIQKVIHKVQKNGSEHPAENGEERVKRAVLSTLRPVFDVPEEKFDLKAANEALKSVVYGIRKATIELGVQPFATIFYMEMTKEHEKARFAETTQGAPVVVKPKVPTELEAAVTAGVKSAIAAAAAAA